MGKEEKDFNRCAINIADAPIKRVKKVALLIILTKKGPYCKEMKKWLK